MTNNQLTDAQISNATLIRLIRWADEHKSHYVASALRELQERRNAHSEPVVIANLNQAELDEIEKRLGAAQPDGIIVTPPEYPKTLPCPVLLEPGLRFGKGVSTSTMLKALQRRADYYADLDAMTPEQRAEHEANIEAFKAILPQPAPVAVPDEMPEELLKPLLIKWDEYEFSHLIVQDIWNACRAAMLTGPQKTDHVRK
ncbi:TPA: hypothetical protein ACWZ76_004284 [Klebsiella pneumoniae]